MLDQGVRVNYLYIYYYFHLARPTKATPIVIPDIPLCVPVWPPLCVRSPVSVPRSQPGPGTNEAPDLGLRPPECLIIPWCSHDECLLQCRAPSATLDQGHCLYPSLLI